MSGSAGHVESPLRLVQIRADAIFRDLDVVCRQAALIERRRVRIALLPIRRPIAFHGAFMPVVMDFSLLHEQPRTLNETLYAEP